MALFAVFLFSSCDTLTVVRVGAWSPIVTMYPGSQRSSNGLESDKEETEMKRNDSNQRPRSNGFVTTGNGAASPTYSPYIASVISDFSNELNDPSHVISNVTQALRLWASSALDEEQYTELLYEAKRVTRTYQGKQGLNGIDNKMAYFFKVLRDLCNGS